MAKQRTAEFGRRGTNNIISGIYLRHPTATTHHSAQSTRCRFTSVHGFTANTVMTSPHITGQFFSWCCSTCSTSSLGFALS